MVTEETGGGVNGFICRERPLDETEEQKTEELVILRSNTYFKQEVNKTLRINDHK